jgi:hypothetical protein
MEQAIGTWRMQRLSSVTFVVDIVVQKYTVNMFESDVNKLDSRQNVMYTSDHFISLWHKKEPVCYCKSDVFSSHLSVWIIHHTRSNLGKCEL